ncbi:hypothetical protein [Methylorubrum sp. SB2]|uniref:hypothetical protein n=1 Tax=Methylorubrum subtropicum TaxID=3138812 RepID=UPI00313CB677
MTSKLDTLPLPSSPAAEGPVLDARIRLRLGRQLQALFDPVLDEELDPRLAALLQQLDQDRQAPEGA